MSDDYPTTEELMRVQDWSSEDPSEWLAFVKSVWWAADWGWHEEDAVDKLLDKPIRRYHISTGGWSGNEDLITVMQGNFVMWALTWESHRRGGHYVFEVPLTLMKASTLGGTDG